MICLIGYLLNVVDLIMTLHYVGSGLAEEANPLVAWLIDSELIIPIKTIFCAVCFYAINLAGNYPDAGVQKVAKYGSIFIMSAYGLLVTYQIIMAFIVGW